MAHQPTITPATSATGPVVAILADVGRHSRPMARVVSAMGATWPTARRVYTRARNLMKAGRVEERAFRSAFNQQGPWGNS